MTKVKANRNGWVFDFSSITSTRDLIRINKAMSGAGVEESVDLVREYTTAWPLDGDVNDIEAWYEMPPGDWMDAQDKFLNAFNNFLETEKRRR